MPWAGHSARYAIAGDLRAQSSNHRTTLLFVNTRSQAELLFQELWRVNEDVLPIALHHGSLDVASAGASRRRWRATACAPIVATSTLDLGIDWGDVDLVIHVGAPKGASRLAQRIGRSNHRMDEPSRAILVPANRFEVLECRAALEANYLGAQDTPPLVDGALDVLAQHVLGWPAPSRSTRASSIARCAAPRPMPGCRARPSTAWSTSSRPAATRCAPMSATPASAATRTAAGASRIPRIAQQYRLNVGTIVEAPYAQRRATRAPDAAWPQRGGPALGKIEEDFLETLAPGDTFLFAGKVLRFEGIRENECFVSNATGSDATMPFYAGGKFPLSTYLADEVRAMLADPERWKALPDQVADWLRIQEEKSVLPRKGDLLVETFPRGERHYMVAYPFEGRLAHQTLGMLLTRRLERAGARPLGFVATDYSLAIWALGDMGAMFKQRQAARSRELFDEDMLGDDLDAWLAESWLLKRTFRNCARDRRPDREAASRQGEDRPAGDRVGRPDLRRAAHARARPHPAAGHARRRRDAACSMSGDLARCSRAFAGESCISSWSASRRSPCRSCWKSARRA